MNQGAGEVWKVGELARSTGLTVRTLHHYDQVGLVQPSGRTVAGHRLYDAGDVQRLYQVVALRALGLSLEAVRAVLAGPPNVQTLLHGIPGSVVGWTELPTTGDELHHFGWNACSSALMHAGHHGGARRVAAALPGAARSAQLERAHLRHSSRPARASAAQEHHPGRAERQGRLLPPAHPALRPGRAVPVLPGRGRRSGRTGRHRPARPRHVRRDAGLRDRPGPAVHGLRRVVAPHPEHVDHQRVGHPVDDRGRGGA